MCLMSVLVKFGEIGTVELTGNGAFRREQRNGVDGSSGGLNSQKVGNSSIYRWMSLST